MTGEILKLVSTTEIFMDETTRSRIRHIFLSPRPNFALMTAADLLGLTLKELKREIEDGAIVTVWTALGERMTRGAGGGGDADVGAVRHRSRPREGCPVGAAGGDPAGGTTGASSAVSARRPARSGAAGRDVGRCGADAGAGRRRLGARRGADRGGAGAGHGVGGAGWGGGGGGASVDPGSGTFLK